MQTLAGNGKRFTVRFSGCRKRCFNSGKNPELHFESFLCLLSFSEESKAKESEVGAD